MHLTPFFPHGVSSNASPNAKAMCKHKQIMPKAKKNAPACARLLPASGQLHVLLPGLKTGDGPPITEAVLRLVNRSVTVMRMVLRKGVQPVERRSTVDQTVRLCGCARRAQGGWSHPFLIKDPLCNTTAQHMCTSNVRAQTHPHSTNTPLQLLLPIGRAIWILSC